MDAAVTPFDTPNLTLLLSEPATLRTYFGFTRSGTELQLRVASPSELGQVLEHHQVSES